MGFLDNSGDIILDAVLTDLGRERLARGDGSFKITKFAAADDEIDYAKYNKNNSSGSAYYDLDILTTPVLEAFTNNISSCKHKLMTIPRNNLLYLPVVKLANNVNGVNAELCTTTTVSGLYLVTVDNETSVNKVGTKELYTQLGIIRGDGQPAGNGGDGSTQIVVDQGLDTTKIPSSFTLDSDLMENQYIIEIDDRLGKINTPLEAGNALANPNFIDDDRIASYYLSATSNPNFVSSLPAATNNEGTNNSNISAVAGPRGTRLKFTIRASLELNTSTSLFSRLGGTFGLNTDSKNYGSHRFIDSTVRITGVTTGYRLDIPVRFIKKV
tara:strand:+ start:392 stop:1372 length:981 start_codon:yes stop_codon:yes gene_type:complete